MKRALVPVLLAVLLDLLGFGLVIPLLSYYAEDTGASPVQVTLLMACYSLAQFVFAPAWGRLSDRVGRRPVMLVSIGATALFLALFGTADALGALFLWRTLHGAAAANVSTAQACVADLTTPEDRAKGMGLIGAAFGLGFTLGPWVGGELARFGLAVPILVAAGLSALNFVLALALLPETRDPAASREGARPRRTIHPAVFLEVARHPVVGRGVVLTFVMTVAFAMMESTFALFAEHARHLDATRVGRMFGVAGVVTIVVQGGLIGRLVRRFGERRLVPAGLALLAAGLALLPQAPPVVAMVAVFSLIAVGQGIATPSLQSLVSKGADEAEQGFVLGTNQSMAALARVVGPVIGGWCFTHLGPPAPFLAAGGVLALAAVASLRAFPRPPVARAAPARRARGRFSRAGRGRAPAARRRSGCRPRWRC